MTRKKTGRPTPRPKSFSGSLKGVLIGHAAKTLMGQHNPFPLSEGPLPTFNKGYSMMFNTVRNNQRFHRIVYPSAINSKMVRYLNLKNIKSNSWHHINTE